MLDNKPAVVVFPTPPFPDATSIILLTLGSGFFSGSPRAITLALCSLTSLLPCCSLTVAQHGVD